MATADLPDPRSPRSEHVTEQPDGCASCALNASGRHHRLGLGGGESDYVVALAGNPNTGKSTVFNALTGLRQHVGNWPGKTVARAEGGFGYAAHRYRLVDLPGTYSLLSTSGDEDIARDFLLFEEPDVTVVVLDASRVERNLNLALQILQITDRVVVALNLMDEAGRHGVDVDVRHLSRALGVPVVPMTARRGEGVPELLRAVEQIAHGEISTKHLRVRHRDDDLERALTELADHLRADDAELTNARWVALRLLERDPSIAAAVRVGGARAIGRSRMAAGSTAATTYAGDQPSTPEPGPAGGDGEDPLGVSVLEHAERLRAELPEGFRDAVVESLYAEVDRIVATSVSRDTGRARLTFDRALDRILTHRVWGFLAMGVLFFGVFWFTIAGASVPSDLLYSLLVDNGHAWLRGLFETLQAPGFVTGLLVDGVYLGTAWVVAVMLPPMAIFFPLFTLLEDFGYLPRVAFNLDRLFAKAGAHGKQSLTMMMGYGCNAAGVTATRIIDSPRERLIAIITNNFSICNGRWPTLILMGTIFIGSTVPPALASLVAAASVLAVALLGVAVTLLVSWGLSRTVLRGEVSAYSLELPPYRPPQVLRTLYTSLIDRTLKVLRRAVFMAAPAGAVIWLLGNVTIQDQSLAAYAVSALDPIGVAIGLNGIILLAYVVAIPANEIIIPTILMLTITLGTHGANPYGAQGGVMIELGDAQTATVLTQVGGWTLLTAVNLMLFSLLHNPCSTTILTIWNETRNIRWTAIATVLPLVLGFGVTFLTASVARSLGWP